jgi:hypothetical protein
MANVAAKSVATKKSFLKILITLILMVNFCKCNGYS